MGVKINGAKSAPVEVDKHNGATETFARPTCISPTGRKKSHIW